MKEPSPVEQVEAHLRIRHLYNIEHEICSDENIIIERLLADHINMALVYDELFSICPRGYPRNSNYERWQYVVNAVVETALGWNPEKIKSVREAAWLVGKKNNAIKKKAAELAELLRDRDELCDLNSLEHPDDYHPLWLIEPATKIADRKGAGQNTHYKYTSWLKKNVDALRGQFDLKYWPSAADMLDALADMQGIKPAPRNKLDAAALEVRQASTRYFLRALDAALLELDCFDIEIKFSDKSLAAIMNCVLDLDGKIEPSNTKQVRAYDRKRNR